MIRFEKQVNSSNIIFGVLFLLAFLFVLFWLAKSIFTILAWIAPALLIATVIIDYQTIVNYVKTLWYELRYRTLTGILYVLLTIVGFPIVSLFLLVKAMFRKKMKAIEKSHREQREGTYTEYEIVDEDEPQSLDLPPLQRRKKEAYDDYEQLFD